MFRTSLVRTAATVAARRTAARTFASRPAAAASTALRVHAVAATTRTAGLVAGGGRVGGVRMYSAAGGLSKEDVEGRIVSLLAGFDKVS